MSASAGPVPPRRAKRGRAAPPLSEGETLVRAARAPQVAAGGGGGARPGDLPSGAGLFLLIACHGNRRQSL